MMEWIVSTEQNWSEVASEIAGQLRHKILLLRGEMGAGKTTFTRELMTVLGSEEEVSSPTYALVNEYRTDSGIVYHFDLFRINEPAELENMGFQEYLEKGSLTIIEWPDDFMDELMCWDFHKLSIEKTENGRRAVFE